MSSEQVSEWTEVVSFLLWVNGGGATHTFDEYRAWLELAGFTQVAKLSERWASGTRRAERRRASSA